MPAYARPPAALSIHDTIREAGILGLRDSIWKLCFGTALHARWQQEATKLCLRTLEGLRLNTLGEPFALH